MRALSSLAVLSMLLCAWPAGAAKKKAAAFDATASAALQAMEKRATELHLRGVAVVAFAEGKTVNAWSSRMRVVGRMRTEPTDKEPGANLLAIAYAKASEMADSGKNSGKAERPKLTGETGWEGGVVKQGERGVVIAAFSGGASEDDVKVSQAGLEVLAGLL